MTFISYDKSNKGDIWSSDRNILNFCEQTKNLIAGQVL